MLPRMSSRGRFTCRSTDGPTTDDGRRTTDDGRKPAGDGRGGPGPLGPRPGSIRPAGLRPIARSRPLPARHRALPSALPVGAGPVGSGRGGRAGPVTDRGPRTEWAGSLTVAEIRLSRPSPSLIRPRRIRNAPHRDRGRSGSPARGRGTARMMRAEPISMRTASIGPVGAFVRIRRSGRSGGHSRSSGRSSHDSSGIRRVPAWRETIHTKFEPLSADAPFERT
jgi:hypothetical protein